MFRTVVARSVKFGDAAEREAKKKKEDKFKKALQRGNSGLEENTSENDAHKDSSYTADDQAVVRHVRGPAGQSNGRGKSTNYLGAVQETRNPQVLDRILHKKVAHLTQRPAPTRGVWTPVGSSYEPHGMINETMQTPVELNEKWVGGFLEKQKRNKLPPPVILSNRFDANASIDSEPETPVQASLQSLPATSSSQLTLHHTEEADQAMATMLQGVMQEPTPAEGAGEGASDSSMSESDVDDSDSDGARSDASERAEKESKRIRARLQKRKRERAKAITTRGTEVKADQEFSGMGDGDVLEKWLENWKVLHEELFDEHESDRLKLQEYGHDLWVEKELLARYKVPPIAERVKKLGEKRLALAAQDKILRKDYLRLHMLHAKKEWIARHILSNGKHLDAAQQQNLKRLMGLSRAKQAALHQPNHMRRNSVMSRRRSSIMNQPSGRRLSVSSNSRPHSRRASSSSQFSASDLSELQSLSRMLSSDAYGNDATMSSSQTHTVTANNLTVDYNSRRGSGKRKRLSQDAKHGHTISDSAGEAPGPSFALHYRNLDLSNVDWQAYENAAPRKQGYAPHSARSVSSGGSAGSQADDKDKRDRRGRSSPQQQVPLELQRSYTEDPIVRVGVDENLTASGRRPRVGDHARRERSQSGNREKRTTNTNIYLQDMDPIIQYAKHGQAEDLQKLIHRTEEAKREQYVNGKDKNGSSPLHHTVWEARLNCLQILLKNKADVNHRNIKQNTALHLACERGSPEHLPIVQELVMHGADLEARNWKKETPLETQKDIVLQMKMKLLISEWRLYYDMRMKEQREQAERDGSPIVSRRMLGRMSSSMSTRAQEQALSSELQHISLGSDNLTVSMPGLPPYNPASGTAGSAALGHRPSHSRNLSRHSRASSQLSSRSGQSAMSQGNGGPYQSPMRLLAKSMRLNTADQLALLGLQRIKKPPPAKELTVSQLLDAQNERLSEAVTHHRFRWRKEFEEVRKAHLTKLTRHLAAVDEEKTKASKEAGLRAAAAQVAMRKAPARLKSLVALSGDPTAYKSVWVKAKKQFAHDEVRRQKAIQQQQKEAEAAKKALEAKQLNTPQQRRFSVMEMTGSPPKHKSHTRHVAQAPSAMSVRRMSVTVTLPSDQQQEPPRFQPSGSSQTFLTDPTVTIQDEPNALPASRHTRGQTQSNSADSHDESTGPNAQKGARGVQQSSSNDTKQKRLPASKPSEEAENTPIMVDEKAGDAWQQRHGGYLFDPQGYFLKQGRAKMQTVTDPAVVANSTATEADDKESPQHSPVIGRRMTHVRLAGSDLTVDVASLSPAEAAAAATAAFQQEQTRVRSPIAMHKELWAAEHPPTHSPKHSHHHNHRQHHQLDSGRTTHRSNRSNRSNHSRPDSPTTPDSSRKVDPDDQLMYKLRHRKNELVHSAVPNLSFSLVIPAVAKYRQQYETELSMSGSKVQAAAKAALRSVHGSNGVAGIAKVALLEKRRHSELLPLPSGSTPTNGGDEPILQDSQTSASHRRRSRSVTLGVPVGASAPDDVAGAGRAGRRMPVQRRRKHSVVYTFNQTSDGRADYSHHSEDNSPDANSTGSRVGYSREQSPEDMDIAMLNKQMRAITTS